MVDGQRSHGGTGRVPAERPRYPCMFLPGAPGATVLPPQRARVMAWTIAYRRGSLHLRAFLARLRWLAGGLRALALVAAGRPGIPAAGPLVAADHRPADDLAPTEADLRAHAVLTAAPPRSPAPVIAGAAA